MAEAGADLEAKDEFGKTALIYAAALDNIEIVRILLKSRANPTAEDNLGLTALEWAIEEKNTDVVKLLQI